MAQIREFESTTESYFILDGVSYPKVYEAMYDDIRYSDTKVKLVPTNRDTNQLVFSTQYTNILVDGESFDTALEAISRLNQVVFSKGGGSGSGGTGIQSIQEGDNITVDATDPLNPIVSATGVGGDFIPLTGTEEGKPVTGPVSFIDLDSNPFIKLGYNPDTDETGLWYNNGEDEISRLSIHNGGVKFQAGFNAITFNNSYGIGSTNDFSNEKPEDKLIYTQRAYVDKANSYSTEELKTGGTWIDGKPIYTITQLTVDAPPTYETLIDSKIKAGTYTEYEFTKVD